MDQDRQARLRNKFLSRDSANDDTTSYDTNKTPSSDDKLEEPPKYNMKLVISQLQTKSAFDEYFRSVHIFVSIIAGCLFSINSKYMLFPAYNNITYIILFLELLHLIYQKLFYYSSLQELNQYLKENPESDVIKQYAGEQASGVINTVFKALSFLGFFKQIMQDVVAFIFAMIVTLAIMS